MLTTVEDVVAAIEGDPRFKSWLVGTVGPGFCEIMLGKSVLVLAWPALWRDKAQLAPHLIRARSGIYPLVLVGTDEEFVRARVDQITGAMDLGVLSLPMSVERLTVTLRNQFEMARLRRATAKRDLMLEQTRYEKDLLISIGRALSQERDIESLLGMVLRKAREVTGADAGTVYVVEGEDLPVNDRTLRFAASQNDSVRVSSQGFTLPVSPSSIVGTCVLHGEVINIPDLYGLDHPGQGNNPWGFVHDRTFDERHQYQTRSMLTVPMISARSQVIGVIQLINKRARSVLMLTSRGDFDSKVVPFDEASTEIAATLASQAGIALENAALYDEVRTLFEGFVHASVTAIESRDPTTSGHSQRVADLTVGLAKVTDRVDRGIYAGLHFTGDELKQLQYAALLHDFGKVGVREHVLVKAKKLYEHERELVLERFKFIRRTLETEQLAGKVRYLVEASRDQAEERMRELDDEARGRLLELDDFVLFILKANEPALLEQGGFERVAEIAARTYLDLDGQRRPYLRPEETLALQIGRGSLTSTERAEIESHVLHTYNFLNQIPWGRVFKDIPAIAGSHHEKLDGSGYPRRLPAAAIPVPTRMMTISDIYDALTASDRPYKRAVPEPKALDILASEVKSGKLDGDLFQLFVDAKVYELARTSRP